MDQYINNNQLPNEIPPLNSEVGEFLKDLSEYLKDVGDSVKRESSDIISDKAVGRIDGIKQEIEFINETAQEKYRNFIIDGDFNSAELVLADRIKSYDRILADLPGLCKDITVDLNPGKYAAFIERGKDLFINAGGTEDEFESCVIDRESIYKDTYNEKAVEEEADEPNRENVFDQFAERLYDYVSEQLKSNKHYIHSMDEDTEYELNGLYNDLSQGYTGALNDVEEQLEEAKDGEDYKQIKALSEQRQNLIQEKIDQLNGVADSLKNDTMGFTNRNGSVHVDQLLSFAKQLDVMDRRYRRQDERDAKKIMKKSGVNPEEYNDTKLEQAVNETVPEQNPDAQENGIHTVLGELANNLKRAVEGPEQKPDALKNDNNIRLEQAVNETVPEQEPNAQKNDNNIRLDNPVIDIVQHNGNIKLEPSVAEAAPEKNSEEKLSKAEIDIFKEHINNLQKAKTFKNSDEYKLIIDGVSDLTNDDSIPMKVKANFVASAIRKYLNHKSKDGVKSNVFKKLAAVETLSQDVDKLIDKLELKEKQTRPDADFSHNKTGFKTMYRLASNEAKEKFNGIVQFTSDCKLEDYKGLDGTQLSMNQKKKVATAMNDADMCMKKILLGAMNQKPAAINDLIKMKNKFHDAEFAAKEFGFSLTKAPKEQGPVIR